MFSGHSVNSRPRHSAGNERIRCARGFSLVELLIVVAVILVIAAIAVPRFLESRMSANEASAVASVHQINTAETTYSVTYSEVGFAGNLAELGPPSSGIATSAHAGLVDWVLGCATQPCVKSGYQFAIVNTAGSPVYNYTATAVPVRIGQTGKRGFCGDRNSRITVDPDGGSNCIEPLSSSSKTDLAAVTLTPSPHPLFF